MSDRLVFLIGEHAPQLRRHDATQLARELERLTVIDGDPLPGAKSAAAGHPRSARSEVRTSSNSKIGSYARSMVSSTGWTRRSRTTCALCARPSPTAWTFLVK